VEFTALGDLLDLLALLRAGFDHAVETDAMPDHVASASSSLPAELTFYASGDHGVLVLPRQRPPTRSYRTVFDALGATSIQSAVLGNLVARVPAARHAIRSRLSGALSVFLALDLSAWQLDALAPLGATDLASP